MSDKYIVTVSKVSLDRLDSDQLSLPDLPEVLNSVTEDLAPSGSIDLQLVYLLTAEQCDAAVKALEENSTRYPRQRPRRNSAKVINLHAHRSLDDA